MMTEDDLKMVAALVQHMGHKIDQIAGSALSPIGQILIEELKAASHRLQGIVLHGSSGSAIPVPVTPVTAVPAPAPIAEPVAPPAQAFPSPTPMAAAPIPLAAVDGVPQVAPQKKVLFLIDDDKDAQKVLAYMFERKSSFRVVSHTDPLKAWEEIKLNPPDLILMDLMMPGISGLDLLKNIRQINELRNVKILIGSSKSFDKDRIEVLKAGANDFIAKPYNFTELLLRLNKLAG
jgi:two-component system OmpR family response regulator